MAEPHAAPPSEGSPQPRPESDRINDRLDSWKEIAAYLNRDVTTVQRWEKREGMPVHRHLHDQIGSVYASRVELDAWVSSRNLRAAQQNENDVTLRDTPIQPPSPSSLSHSDNAQALNIQVGPAPGSKIRIPKLRWLLAACLVLTVVVGAWIRHQRQQPQPPIHSLAVLPLKNLSGDPAQEYFADGMTEEVIGRLSMIRGLRVISRTSVMQFKDTKLLAPEIARKLGVDALVEGSVIRDGNRIRVHAQLIRASTDEHFWSEEYDRELQDTLALESEVAQSIARRVEVTVTGEERARLVGAREVAPDVYESYLKGRGAIPRANSRAEIERSVAYFEEAIRKDPTFAPAYVGLASAYDKMGLVVVGAMPPGDAREKVISAARKALELDPDIPEAHAQLAFAYMQHWQWRDAEAEYRRALELNPNDAAANGGFGGWLMVQGRMDEALAMLRRAVEVDPLGESGADLGWVLFNARRYDEAIRELRSVVAVRPDDAWARLVLGQVLIRTGQS